MRPRRCCDDACPVIARMGLLASELAHQAAAAVEQLDPHSGDRLARADDEVDALRRELFRIVFAKSWARGVESAVHAALLGRYYERFADHAVAVAREVCYLTTGRTPSRSNSPSPGSAPDQLRTAIS